VNAVIPEQKESLVASIVNLGNTDRTAERSAVTIEQKIGTRRAGLVQEKIIGPKAGTLEGVVGGSVETVGAALDADVGDAALGLPELRVEGVGLNFELLHDVGRRNV